jgi:MATE family multidrug resistance protein
METEAGLDRKIWSIAWPAILSNISIPLLGLVDAAILGHLGSTRFLGAVAIGSALLSFLYWGFSFLRMGTTGLVAKAIGAGDTRRALEVLVQSCALALLLGLAVIIAHPLWLELGFVLMAPREEILPLADSYATIRIYSAPVVLITYTVVGWFIGQQDTRWPMLIVVVTNVVNIGLDFLLIIGFGLNSDGAALATLIAEYMGCALALWAVCQKLGYRPGGELIDSLKGLDVYKDLLRSNRHLFIRTVCLLFGFAFFTAAGDKLGAETLAANTLLIQLVILSAFALDGFAFAAEGLAGNRLGAGDEPGFQQAARRCAWWCMLTGVLVSLVYLLFHSLLFNLLSDIEPVRQIMDEHYLWLAVLPLLSAPSYLLDGIFIGSAETRYMMVTMLFSTLVVYLPLWYLTRHWGNHGLWFAFTAFNLARSLTLYACFSKLNREGGWLRDDLSSHS